MSDPVYKVVVVAQDIPVMWSTIWRQIVGKIRARGLMRMVFVARLEVVENDVNVLDYQLHLGEPEPGTTAEGAANQVGRAMAPTFTSPSHARH